MSLTADERKVLVHLSLRDTWVPSVELDSAWMFNALPETLVALEESGAIMHLKGEYRITKKGRSILGSDRWKRMGRR